MIFHSLDFVAFFVIMVTLYWRLSHTWQNRLLLVGSYVFYGWIHPWFLTLIFSSTVVDYWTARRMVSDPGRRRLYLVISLVANLGLLGFFKYFNFFVDSVAAGLQTLQLPVTTPVLEIFLPVGISFFTFQALSYTIDVYRGRLDARSSFIDVATFVALFPQLVAGPIERASALLPQIEAPRRFSAEAARSGLLLIAWGYFKKLVVADSTGVIANKVFSISEPSFEVLWAGVFAFGIQIYADFSAYSDIARGVARWFGIELMLNFDHPYLATGPRDFWRRWHISLSSWFRDYVYIPLGGSRHGVMREIRNLLLTFLLSGLWHGASWNFVAWGFYHGLLLGGSRLASMFPSPSPGWLAILAPARIVGMFVLVNIGWLLFRESDWSMLVRGVSLSPLSSTTADREAGLALFLLAVPYALPLFTQSLWVEFRRNRPSIVSARGQHIWWLRTLLHGLAAGALFATVLILRSQTSLDFIYFRF